MIENSRSCVLSLASALACLSLAACDHYDRGTDSNAVGSLGAAGAGNNVSAAAPGAGTPGPATGSSTREGNPATGGLVMGGASTGTTGASDGPLDASSGVELDSGASSGGAGGVSAAGGSGGAGSVVTLTSGPCDVYAASNTPCVAAYSMVRKLSSNYAGPLYQVRRGGPNPNTGTGGVTQDIGALPDGFADAAAQDAFCGNQICTVSVLYDQSGRGNNLTVAPAGCYMGTASEDDYESQATARALTVGGHRVYGLYMNPHEGYRDNTTAGMPTGTQSQGVYALVDGKRSGCCCCFDFGNGSTDNCNGPTGLMNALYFGTGYWGRGAGNGPWFLGDFEAGVWAGGNGASNAVNNNSPSMTMDFAFGALKTDANTYALRMGDGQNGNLTTAYNGAAPARWQLQGGIILGIGGDNSNSSFGTFYEGAITAGRPSDATEEAVLRNVQAARYGQ